MHDPTPPIHEIPPAALPSPFRPPPGGANPHVQTLAGKFMRPQPAIPFRRERWETPDGDFLDLDLTEPVEEERRWVLVLHGLEGNSQRRYVRCAVAALHHRGFGVAALNFRSCSGEPNRRARAYHSGETEDLGFVVSEVLRRWPDAPLGAVGFSLGGNVLLKYLSEHGEGSPVRAAVAISVPYDLAAGSDELERTRMGRIYTRYFLRSLVSKIQEKAHLMPDEIDLAKVNAATTLREFDTLVTAPLHGFRDAAHYYAESSSGARLGAIRTPTLLLHSMDDPFMPRTSVPVGAMHDNPWLHPMLTQRGGHVGFLRNSLRRPGLWAEESAARYLDVILPQT